jgi:hypothetical protein
LVVKDLFMTVYLSKKTQKAPYFLLISVYRKFVSNYTKNMKTSIKHVIVATIATPLFFLSCNKEGTNPGTNTQKAMAETRIWHKQTAWSGGADYVKKDSRATYTQYYGNNCVGIYAGQTTYAGTAHFSRVNNGKVTISITLSDGWKLTPGKESIKIQGYTSAPKGQPVPEQFTYKGNNLTVEVNASNYYGIQLEIQE